MKKALITGITGQDGAYLSRFLLSKGYEVHGVIRRSSSFNTARIDDIFDRLNIHYGDMTDSISLQNILQKVQPDEIYNLAAQSHVKVSFELPEYTAQVDAVGTLRLIEAVKILGLKTKIYQASTSELYGGLNCPPDGYTETSPFNPRSPYAIAKLYAYHICKNYREAYNMFICNGILFNHESPYRGDTFVTQKIVKGAVSGNIIKLGNLSAVRDWGHAEDYVEAMWLMLQQETPDDFVIATGKAYSIRQFIEITFMQLGISVSFVGERENEIVVCKNTGKTLAMVDSKYYRPTEVPYLLGNPKKAMNKLGWKPKHTLDSLINKMINAAAKKRLNFN